jgi:hypothetical protein
MNRQILRGATVLAMFAAGAALASGCSPRETSAEQASSAAATEPAAPEGTFRGKAVETMDSGGYTYVLLENGEERIWAAGPETAITVGDDLSVTLAMPMTNFESKTLDRTFETLYFVSAFSGAQSGGGTPADPHAGIPGFATGSTGKPAPGDAAEIDPASIEMPEGGHRIADLWARKGELAGKEVTVRGRVVKYNGGILGRNWIHLQDGTGNPADGTHDLTVTSDAAASVGDVLTVTGTVAVDRDFGAGYSYQLMLEKASVE